MVHYTDRCAYYFVHLIHINKVNFIHVAQTRKSQCLTGLHNLYSVRPPKTLESSKDKLPLKDQGKICYYVYKRKYVTMFIVAFHPA